VAVYSNRSAHELLVIRRQLLTQMDVISHLAVSLEKVKPETVDSFVCPVGQSGPVRTDVARN
jgi:hypothetical protein